MRVHILLIEQPPGHKINGIDLGEILVDADKIHIKRALAGAAYGEIFVVAQVSAHQADAGQLGKGFHSFRIKFAVGLAGVLGIIHVYLDDVDATHEHHVLPHLVPDFAAKYRQDDKRRDAQSDGKHHPEAALAHNLPEADANKV